MNKKNLIAGISFLVGSLFCVINLITQGFETFYVTGIVLFTIFGLAFLRRAKDV